MVFLNIVNNGVNETGLTPMFYIHGFIKFTAIKNRINVFVSNHLMVPTNKMSLTSSI